MELVLFYITQSKELLISFLSLIFIIALIAFISIKTFKQNKKWNVVFYGLFMQMTNLDLIRISILIVKSFIVFFAIFALERIKIYLSIIMIAILSLLYIIISLKRLIHESLCSIIQIIGVYFVFLLSDYSNEVDNSLMISVVLFSIISALMFFTLYVFLKEIDIISTKRVEKEFKIKEKEEVKG